MRWEGFRLRQGYGGQVRVQGSRFRVSAFAMPAADRQGSKNLVASFVANVVGLLVPLMCGTLALSAGAESRFPQPQFDTGHVVPKAFHPQVTPLVSEWMDVALLLIALSVAAWLVHRVRSRRWILALAVLCLAWFGFIRQGCFCPIGAIQNVAVAAWQGGGLAWGIAAFFALPLLFALLFGRVFCAAVCPLGALQEIFIIRPLRVPRAVNAVLRLIPLLVLLFGVVYTLNGAGYLICRTDPFVGLFRRSAPLPLLLTGMAVLLLGMVIARPYCRYFCPYSVLLEACARLAWKPVKITKETCINCRLCSGVCPVDAVEIPREAPNEVTRAALFRRFVKLLVLTPLLVVGLAFAGRIAGGTLLASAHPVVKTYHALLVSTAATEALYPEIEAAKKQGQTREELGLETERIIARFRVGSAVAGGLLGLIIALRMLGLSQLRRRAEHEADRYNCIACARCYPVCPKNVKNV
jgi:NosR/NirI family transcriptional regulator, nitrous oxide reductase regulator